MRGAHSCGAFMALAEKGMTHFDVVVATSAGACTAAFFVSGQNALFPTIWVKYLHDGRFLKLRRFSSRKSVMDIDYLVDEVFGNLQPLDVEAVRKSRMLFYISATDCETGEGIFFNNREHAILPSLKASAALPIAYRGPVIIDGRAYIDGGIADPIPIQKAVDEGCEEVTILLTRPEGFRKKPPLLQILPRLFRKKHPRLAETMAHRNRKYNETMERIETGDFPCRIRVIRPTDSLPVGRLTTRLPRIKEAVNQGYRDAMFALSISTQGEMPLPPGLPTRRAGGSP